MQATFDVHKIYRGIGRITESDKGQLRNLIRNIGGKKINQVSFAPSSPNEPAEHQAVKCTVTFTEKVGTDYVADLLSKTGIRYIEFHHLRVREGAHT